MRHARYLACAFSAVAFVACAPSDNGIDDSTLAVSDSVASMTAPTMAATTMMSTTLGTPANYTGATRPTGTASVTIDSTAGTLRAEITIANGGADAELPWHVHRGTCSDDQGILGEADAYEPIELDDNGSGTASATVTLPMPLTGDYSVNVHQSSDQMSVIVACGDLSKTM
jgi:hypothetical protein